MTKKKIFYSYSVFYKVNKNNIDVVLEEWNDFICHGGKFTMEEQNELVKEINQILINIKNSHLKQINLIIIYSSLI